MLVFQVGTGPQQKSGFDSLGVNPLRLHIERHKQEDGIVEASCGCELQIQCLQLRLELKDRLKFMWQLKAFITPPHVVKGLVVYQWTLWDIITFPLLWSVECILTCFFNISLSVSLGAPEPWTCLVFIFSFHSSSSSTPKTRFLFSLKLHYVEWLIRAENLFSLEYLNFSNNNKCCHSPSNCLYWGASDINPGEWKRYYEKRSAAAACSKCL